jgi:hypothetical protein
VPNHISITTASNKRYRNTPKTELQILPHKPNNSVIRIYRITLKPQPTRGTSEGLASRMNTEPSAQTLPHTSKLGAYVTKCGSLKSVVKQTSEEMFIVTWQKNVVAYLKPSPNNWTEETNGTKMVSMRSR